jgi:2'-hydroxyisoflavone reductase
MRLLTLGGTEFVGRAVVEAALARGWDVTVFHRGRHEPPAGVRSLHGDRTAPDGLAALAGTDEEWDVVVDTWSAAPRVVRDAARLLAHRTRRYVYVSSSSVYAWPAPAGYDEDSPLVADASPDAEQTDYARDKRGGELAVLEAFGAERSLLVRAGLILGPYENIGRLPWWLGRMARGGPVLAPGPRDLPLQYVDVRDLAEWTLGAAETGAAGPYNLISPSGHATMGTLLDACVEVTGAPTGGPVAGGTARGQVTEGAARDQVTGDPTVGRGEGGTAGGQITGSPTRAQATGDPTVGRGEGDTARGQITRDPAVGQITEDPTRGQVAGDTVGGRRAGGPAELRWTDPGVVLAAGIEPWLQLPVWVPPGSESYGALHRADVSRAVRDGLRCRPVVETVADTWNWLQSIGGTAPQRPDRPVVGLDPSVEDKVLSG